MEYHMQYSQETGNLRTIVLNGTTFKVLDTAFPCNITSGLQ